MSQPVPRGSGKQGWGDGPEQMRARGPLCRVHRGRPQAVPLVNMTRKPPALWGLPPRNHSSSPVMRRHQMSLNYRDCAHNP